MGKTWFVLSGLDCHNREQLYPNMHESRQFVSYGGDCVEVCSKETAGTDISCKRVSNLRAAFVAIITFD